MGLVWQVWSAQCSENIEKYPDARKKCDYAGDNFSHTHGKKFLF